MRIKGIKIVVEEPAKVECDEDWHTCPYNEDINGDFETLCNCDAEKTNECAWDI